MKQTDNFKTRFSELRNGLKLSQNEFAKLLDVTQAQISQVETGPRKITVGLEVKLEEKLKINKNWLRTGEGLRFTDGGLLYSRIITLGVKKAYPYEIDNHSKNNVLNEPKAEYKVDLIKNTKVPIYDVEFAAGVISTLIDSADDFYLVGYLSIPEVSGCDVIIRAKGDGMADRINDRDWIGLKKMNKDEWFPLGYIYAIETEQAQVIKYIKKGSTDKTVKIISHNSFYDDEEIALELIKELWSVRTIFPFSKIEMLM